MKCSNTLSQMRFWMCVAFFPPSARSRFRKVTCLRSRANFLAHEYAGKFYFSPRQGEVTGAHVT
jgi:hypothetical protein